jgi:hypothetical protein
MSIASTIGPHQIEVHFMFPTHERLVHALPGTINDTPKEHVFYTYYVKVMVNMDPNHLLSQPWPLTIAQLWFGVKTTKEERLEAIMGVADLCRLRHPELA